MVHSELPLFHEWLHRPHVARWWYEDLGTLEEVSKEYGAYITGEEPVEPYLVLYEGRPIGYIQWYLVSDDEEYERLIDIEDSAGIDVFIGEEEFLHRGFGAGIIGDFIKTVVFADERVAVCIIDPEPENTAAIRAYEKVGFRHFGTVETSGAKAYLMKISRGGFSGAGVRKVRGSSTPE